MAYRKTGWTTVVLLALATQVVAGDGSVLTSGLPVGESVPAFLVKDITGPSQGKTLCYRCRFGNNPCVAVFARTVNAETSKLIAAVDSVAAEKNLKSFVVFVADDPAPLETQLSKLATEKKIVTPLTTFQGSEGPDGYKLNKDADITVMMWVGGEVKANRAYATGKIDKAALAHVADDAKKIAK